MNLDKSEKITDIADICYVIQKEQKGLGDAIKCGERHNDEEPFAVLLGNSITRDPTPCIKQIIDVYNKYVASSISVEEVPLDKVERYASLTAVKLKRVFTKSLNLLKSHQQKRHHQTLQ